MNFRETFSKKRALNSLFVTESSTNRPSVTVNRMNTSLNRIENFVATSFRFT